MLSVFYRRIGSLIAFAFCAFAAAYAVEPNGDAIKGSYDKTKSFIDELKKTTPEGKNKKLKFVDRWLFMNRNEAESVSDIQRAGKKSDRLDKVLSATAWLPIGPENLPPSYESRSGHGLGRINCIAFHPTDKNVFWIGTPGGGIWRTVNGGKNWMPMMDKFASLEISHIAVDPKNPDVLYAATGDYDGKGAYSAKACGVIKSTDGGISWEINSDMLQTLHGATIKRVLVNSENTSLLLAGGIKGIMRSTDAGLTWTADCDSLISDLEADPSNPNVVYAATCTYYNYLGSAGIMKSTDFGLTWSILPTGIPPKGKVSRIELAVSPVDPNYIYALTVSADLSNYSHYNGMDAVYLSTDGGASWSQQVNLANSPNILGSYSGDAQDGQGQGFYDLVLLADARDKNKVYAGGVNIWASSEAGKNWDLASLWMNCFGKSIHADHHAAAFNPLDSAYYWCNDGGIFKTKEIIPGSKDWVTDWIDREAEDIKPGAPDYKFPTVWVDLSDGLMITEFYKLATCKNVADIVAGGSQDNSCFYNNNSEWINYVANYDGMETAIDHDNPEIIYGVWQFGGLCKSTDGGKTVKTGLADTIKVVHQEWGDWVTPLAMDPINSNILYMGFRNVWRSNNGGEKWEKFLDFDKNSTDSTNFSSISLIKPSYTDGNRIAVYKRSYWAEINGNYAQIPHELWITRDGGGAWKVVNVSPSREITAIEFDRHNPDRMWVTSTPPQSFANCGVAGSTDGGVTWEWILKENMPSGIKTIAHQGDEKNTLYIGTEWGVYFTNDELDCWESLDENLPNAIVADLEIDFNSKRLYAATYGRGIWCKTLNAASAADAKTFSVAVYPNPSRGEFNLDFSEVSSAAPILVKILNIRGERVYSGSFPAGSPAHIATALPTGVYFVVAAIGEKTLSAKIEIAK